MTDTDKNITCSICLNDLVCPVKLECGHVFDVTCITEWFRSEKTCPYCRQSLTTAPTWSPDSLNDYVFIFPNYLTGMKGEKFPVSLRANCQMIKCIIADRLNYGSTDSHCDAIYEQSSVLLSQLTRMGIPKHKIDQIDTKPGKPYPRELFINIVDDEKKKPLFSDLQLSDFNLLPGQTYNIYVFHTMNDQCDRCYYVSACEQRSVECKCSEPVQE